MTIEAFFQTEMAKVSWVLQELSKANTTEVIKTIFIPAKVGALFVNAQAALNATLPTFNTSDVSSVTDLSSLGVCDYTRDITSELGSFLSQKASESPAIMLGLTAVATASCVYLTARHLQRPLVASTVVANTPLEVIHNSTSAASTVLDTLAEKPKEADKTETQTVLTAVNDTKIPLPVGSILQLAQAWAKDNNHQQLIQRLKQDVHQRTAILEVFNDKLKLPLDGYFASDIDGMRGYNQILQEYGIAEGYGYKSLPSGERKSPTVAKLG